MDPVSFRAKVDHDGVVRLKVPLGALFADHEVQITIAATPPVGDDHDRYDAWLAGLAGKWQGELARGPEGETERP